MPLKPSDELLVRKHSLDLKFDSQLANMLVSHQSKLDRLRAPSGDLEKYTQDADGMAAVRWELKEQFPEMTISEREQQFFDKQVSYIRKDTILKEIVDIIPIEQDARSRGIVDRKPIGTTFYIDATNGTDSYTGVKITGTIDSSADSTHFVDSALTGADDYINGSFFYNQTTGQGTLIADFVAGTDTATLTDADGSMAAGDTYYILHAWATLHKFTEAARSAGDIAILRRGLATDYDDGGDLEFTSDGTKAAPLIATADNTNEWKDNVDLSATATATLTVGSKTITFSADVSGVVSAADVIYVASEDADEFAYEVASVSTVTVTLYLPYKGAEDGSGKTMTNLQSNPKWGDVAQTNQFRFNGDSCWKFQGLHIETTSVNATLEFNTSTGIVLKDCVFEGAGSGDIGLQGVDDQAWLYLSKCRFFNLQIGVIIVAPVAGFTALFRDCLFDGNSVGSSDGINAGIHDHFLCIECEFKNHASVDVTASALDGAANIRLVNCILASTTEFDIGLSLNEFNSIFSSDKDGVLGALAEINFVSSGSNTPILESDTGTVRSGGGAVSGKCTPSTDLNTTWEVGRQLLFEIALHTTTDSKKYEVFFRPTATADWTADPTAAELWIELEYWGHADNDFRRITKSTGLIDMNGSTTFTALDVTVAPAQAGVAFLRGYYAKTKESGKANTFFWDVVPVVT